MKYPTPLKDIAYHGILGRFVKRILPHSEADPIGLLAHMLTEAGNIIGRKWWIEVGARHHHTNLFSAIVGATSSGRKGTAESDSMHIFRGVDDEWFNNCQLRGLSTGEGLIEAVRDEVQGLERNPKTGKKEMGIIAPGVEDKRLMVIETEFAQVLRASGRDSNTLSQVLRQVWDGDNPQIATKGSPVKSTEPHISLVVHITPDELSNELEDTDCFNGAVNRYLWFLVKRSKLLPEGGELNREDFSQLKAELRTLSLQLPSTAG